VSILSIFFFSLPCSGNELSTVRSAIQPIVKYLKNGFQDKFLFVEKKDLPMESEELEDIITHFTFHSTASFYATNNLDNLS